MLPPVEQAREKAARSGLAAMADELAELRDNSAADAALNKRALANAVGREIIAAGLTDDGFIARATSGFEAYRDAVEPCTLDWAQRETGVPAEAIRELAHAYATADRAILCWTLGITEHHNGTDNVLALINLSLLTGHVGRYGSGLVPIRGQNNVQGGGDTDPQP